MDVKAEVIDTVAESDDEFFWFRIGSKRQFFQVERSLIEHASATMASKMEDQVNSAEENTADLLDVESSTFKIFLTFARSLKSDYTTSRASEDEVQSNPCPELSQLIVLLLNSGQTQFRCPYCCKDQSLGFSKCFPMCDSCLQTHRYIVAESSTARCIKPGCTDPASYVQWLLCQTCAMAYGFLRKISKNNMEPAADAPARLKTSPEQISEDTSLFRFDAPILAREMTSLLRSSPSGAIFMVSDVLELAKLCFLGDRYEVPQLKRAAIFALLEELAWCDVWRRPEHVVQLVEYIYDNTPDSGFSSQYNTKHVLRRMISCYVAFHARDLQSVPAMAAFWCSGREVASDVFMATTKIGASGDKK